MESVMLLSQYLALFAAAFVAGAINSVAGGGTLLTFPALLWAGETAIVANATSTVALVPGALSSFWGYRHEIGPSQRAIAILAIPSLVGGCVGALLLVETKNETFAALVPYLVLLATLLFTVQGPVAIWLKHLAEARSSAKPPTAGRPSKAATGSEPTDANSANDKGGEATAAVVRQSAAPTGPRASAEAVLSGNAQASVGRWALVLGFQFLVAVYGGYFGAGIGILMLAALGFLGFTHIHRMNALKNVNGACINAVAAALFIFRGLVDWRLATLMAAGAILGGYAGAGVARRIGQKNVRRVVILIGFTLTVILLLRR
jgi:uncharacterized membrane protein YfcA